MLAYTNVGIHKCFSNNLNYPVKQQLVALKHLSSIGPNLWNALPNSILSVDSMNNFKHKLKGNFFKEIQKTEDSL